MKILSVFACLLIFIWLLAAGCLTTGITSAPGSWDKYLATPFQERVFEADAFILKKVKNMNLATQKAYPFTRDEKERV